MYSVRVITLPGASEGTPLSGHLEKFRFRLQTAILSSDRPSTSTGAPGHLAK